VRSLLHHLFKGKKRCAHPIWKKKVAEKKEPRATLLFLAREKRGNLSSSLVEEGGKKKKKKFLKVAISPGKKSHSLEGGVGAHLVAPLTGGKSRRITEFHL